MDTCFAHIWRMETFFLLVTGTGESCHAVTSLIHQSLCNVRIRRGVIMYEPFMRYQQTNKNKEKRTHKHLINSPTHGNVLIPLICHSIANRPGKKYHHISGTRESLECIWLKADGSILLWPPPKRWEKVCSKNNNKQCRLEWVYKETWIVSKWLRAFSWHFTEWLV